MSPLGQEAQRITSKVRPATIRTLRTCSPTKKQTQCCPGANAGWCKGSTYRITSALRAITIPCVGRCVFLFWRAWRRGFYEILYVSAVRSPYLVVMLKQFHEILYVSVVCFPSQVLNLMLFYEILYMGVVCFPPRWSFSCYYTKSCM